MSSWINTKTNLDDVVLSSRVRLARNIKGNSFPESIDPKDGRELAEDIYSSINNREDFKFIKLWETEELAGSDIDKLIISKEILEKKEKAAYIKDIEETITVMINEEDHIKIQAILGGLSLKEAYKRAVDLDDKIELSLDYAFDSQYGYVTSSLTNIGTGMRAGVMLHLPALTISQGITSILKGLNQVGMTIRGVYGDKETALGNIYLISNQISLGVNEDEILSNLESLVENIIEEEVRCREKLFSKKRDEMEDKIYRAYGVLKSARLVSMKECLELLSWVRLGVEMAIIDIDKMKLNELLIRVSENTITSLIGSKSDMKAREKKRANIIHEILN